MWKLFVISLALLISSTAACGRGPHGTKAQPPETSDADRITEISLKVSYGWFEEPPDYKVTLRQDGTVTHVDAKTKKQRQGKLNTSYFHRLAKFIEAQRYFELEDVYGKGITDADVFETSVVRRDAPKTVVNVGSAGPPELFGIALAIEGAVSHTRWDEAKN